MVYTSGTKTCGNGVVNKICNWVQSPGQELDSIKNNVITTEVNQWCSSNPCARETTITIVITGFANPRWRVAPNVNNRINIIYLEKSSDGIISQTTQKTNPYIFSPTLTLSKFIQTSIERDISKNKVGEATEYTFQFAITTPLLAGGQIKFIFPDKAIASTNPTLLKKQSLSTPLTIGTPQTYNPSKFVKSITINDLCTTGCATNDKFNIILTSVNNPDSTRPIPNRFIIQSLYQQGHLVDQNTLTNVANLDLVPNALEDLSIQIDKKMTGDITNYKIIAKTKNSTPANGKFQVVFPDDIALLKSTSCKGLLNKNIPSLTLNCLINTATRTASLYVSSIIPSDTQFTLTVENVRNPQSFKPSKFFQITTYEVDGSSSYSIDQSKTQNVTMDIPNKLTGNVFKRIPTIANQKVPIINKPQNHFFSFRIFNPIPKNGSIRVQYSGQLIQIPLNAQLGVFEVDSSNNLTSKSILKGNVSATVFIVQPCKDNKCAEKSILRFMLTGAKTPNSTKLPSDKVKIQTFTDDGFKIDEVQNQLVLPVSQGPLQQLVIDRVQSKSSNTQIDQVGKNFSLRVDWIPTTKLEVQGQFHIYFSEKFAYIQESKSLQCQFGKTGLEQSATCVASNQDKEKDQAYNQDIIKKIKVTLPTVSTPITQSDINKTKYSVIVKNLQNPFNVDQAKIGTIAAFTFRKVEQQAVNSGLVQLTTAELPVLSPGILTNVKINRKADQTFVDHPVQLNFSFSSATKVISGHSVVFYIPRPFFEIDGDPNLFNPVCSVSCQGSVSNSLITIFSTNLICQPSNPSRPCPPTPNVKFEVRKGLKNAYNLLSQSGDFIIRSTTNDPTVFVDEYKDKYTVTPQLKASQTTVQQITPVDYIAGQVTTLTIKFKLASKVLSSDYLQVQFQSVDSIFNKSKQAVSCKKIISGNVEISISSCQLTLSGSKIQKVRANQFCAPTGCKKEQQFSLQINNLKLLGYSKQVAVTVTVNTKTPGGSDNSGFLIGTGQQSYKIQVNPNTFKDPKIETVVQRVCTSQINQNCQMKFTMTTKNLIPSKANNGKLEITIPGNTSPANPSFLQIQPNPTTTCKIDGSQTDVDCSIDISKKKVTLQHNGRNTDQKEIVIMVKNIKLPDSTKPTNTFDLTSYYSTFKIDQVDSLTFSAKPGSLQNIEVTRGVARIRQPTEYKFKFTSTNNIPETYKFSHGENFAFVRIQFPPISQLEFIPDLDPANCSIIKKKNGLEEGISPTLTIENSKTLPTSVQFLRFQSVCRAGQQCPAGTEITITCPKEVIRNKRYKKLVLDNVTDSIQMGFSTPDNKYWFDAKIQGLFAKPDLEPGELKVNQLSRSGNKVSQLVSLTVDITPLFSNHISTSKLMLKINPRIFLDPNQKIQAVNTANSQTVKTAYIFKKRQKTNPIEIQLLAVNFPCGQSSICPINVAFGYNIQYLRNPLVAIKMPTDSMEIYTATQDGYQLDRGFSKPLNQILTSMYGASFQKVKIWAQDPTVSRQTAYDFIFKLDSKLNSLAYLDLKISSTTLTLVGNPECSDLFDATNTKLACEIVKNQEGGRDLRVTNIISQANAKPPELASGYFGIKIKKLKNPDNTDPPGNITAWLFIPAGEIAKGDYPVPPAKKAIPDIQCSQKCKGCAGTPEFCISCYLPGQLPFKNGEVSNCLSSCSSNQFLNPIDKKCYECESSCQTCFGYRAKDCITCVSPKHKSDGECFDNCPAQTTAKNVNNISVCQNDKSPSLCTAPCLTCSLSSDYCLTCSTQTTEKDTINPLAGTCVSSTTPSPHQCPKGYYPVASGNYKSCNKCYHLCGSCLQRANKCLSCLPKIFIQSIYNENENTCSINCPKGKYLAVQGCYPCNEVCSTCTGRHPNQCTSCNQSIPQVSALLYLYKNQCVAQCPHPYSQNVESQTCDNPPFSLSKSVPLFIEIPLLVASIAMMLTSVCIVGSKSVKKGGGKFIWWNALYALISLIQFVNRFLLIGNLFDKRYPVHFAINFTVLFTSLFLGMLSHINYFQPLTYTTVFYSKLFQKFKCGFITVIIFAYIGGSNVFRLISSKFLGVKSLSNQFGVYTFWIRPLEVFGWFMAALSIAQIILCIVMISTFPVYNDAFMCAILGMIWNTAIVVMQTCTWIYAQKNYPLSKLDDEEAELIDIQHPQFVKA